MNSSLTLVTGATGLLGNNVVRLLLERGQPVRVLAREGCDARPLAGLDVEIVRGDVCDGESVRRACRRVDRVVHAAGYVHIGRSGARRQQEVNIEGSRHVAAAAAEAGARMVHVSSVNALGIRSLKHPADEETPLGGYPNVPYVVTKRAAEQVVLQWVRRGLSAVIVNPDFMLGPFDWKPSSGQMLLAVGQGKVLLAPRGWLGTCDVRDVAAGILAALERGTSGRRYIMSGPTVSYADALRLFAEVTGARKPITLPGPLALMVVGWACDLWTDLSGREPPLNSAVLQMARLPKCYSSARAEAELGYRTRPLRESVQDAWAWFQQHGYV